MDALAAFGLPGPACVHAIGAGGKTTLLLALADAARAAGRSAIVTTTTRMGAAEAGPAAEVVIAGAAPGAGHDALRAALARSVRVVFGASVDSVHGKLVGLPPGAVDALAAARLADLLLVEADGSAKRPLKAHAAHEPVIAPSADLVIAVVGAAAVGAHANDAHVHRSGLLRGRLGIAHTHVISPADVARIVFHEEGWLARVSAGLAVAVFVSHDSSPARIAGADAIAAALHTADTRGRIARIVTGDARVPAFTQAGGPAPAP